MAAYDLKPSGKIGLHGVETPEGPTVPAVFIVGTKPSALSQLSSALTSDGSVGGTPNNIGPDGGQGFAIVPAGKVWHVHAVHVTLIDNDGPGNAQQFGAQAALATGLSLDVISYVGMTPTLVNHGLWQTNADLIAAFGGRHYVTYDTVTAVCGTIVCDPPIRIDSSTADQVALMLGTNDDPNVTKLVGRFDYIETDVP